MLTPESVMKFGKYKNKKISEIPEDYMIKLYQNSLNSFNVDQIEFNEYVLSLYPDLKVEFASKKSVDLIADNFVKTMCSKEFFINESDAKYRLHP